jgi:alkylation response protein AidB-like acyl-CoA dehydrogenase
MLVYAKLDIAGEEPGRRPFQGFVFERGMPGLSTGKPMEKMGMRAHRRDFLDDANARALLS